MNADAVTIRGPRAATAGAAPRNIAYVYGALLALTYTGVETDSELRWAIYLLPIAVAFFEGGRLALRTWLTVVAATALISVSYVLAVFSADDLSYGARWYLFVIATPVCFLFIPRMDDGSIKIITGFIGVASLIVVAFALINGESIWSDRMLFVDSDPSAAASGLAFPAGACVIYFCITRQWKWATFATILLVLGFKRVAIVGVLFGLGLLWVQSVVKPKRRQHEYLIILAMFSIGLICALFLETLFIGLADAFLPAGTSVNAWTMGRYELTQRLIRDLIERDWVSLLFGKGPGYSEFLTTQATVFLRNPHDDYLLLLIDLGAFGAAANFVAWCLLNGGSPATLALAGYTAVLYLTDNTYIYFFHTFVVTAIVSAFERRGGVAFGESAAVPQPVGKWPARTRRSLSERGEINRPSAGDAAWPN